ncbi:MAG: hypothetical protein IT459_22530, partial [Planctomycetes bacterium]|nr:hypothetical protein [Planctomycetota bacterium]
RWRGPPGLHPRGAKRARKISRCPGAMMLDTSPGNSADESDGDRSSRPGLVTQAEFARRYGVTRQAVGDLVARGVIQLVDELVDEAAAIAAIARSHDPARPSKVLEAARAAGLPVAPSAEEEARSFNEAKTRRELAEAKRAELRLAKESGELVELAAVVTAWSNLVNAARTRLLAVSSSPDIPDALRPVIAARIGEALQELADHDPGSLVETD